MAVVDFKVLTSGITSLIKIAYNSLTPGPGSGIYVRLSQLPGLVISDGMTLSYALGAGREADFDGYAGARLATPTYGVVGGVEITTFPEVDFQFVTGPPSGGPNTITGAFLTMEGLPFGLPKCLLAGALLTPPKTMASLTDIITVNVVLQGQSAF